VQGALRHAVTRIAREEDNVPFLQSVDNVT